MKARLSNQAKQDIAQIWEYIAEDNESAADRLVQRFIRQYQTLAENPGLGRTRSNLRPSLRSFPIGNYLILYRATENGIDVVRILHGMRNLEVLFAKETEETYQDEDETSIN